MPKRKKKASPRKQTTKKKKTTPKRKPSPKKQPKKAAAKLTKKTAVKRGRPKSNPAFAKKVGANVRSAREIAGMTQAVLAKRLNVQPPRVAAIEKGSGGEPKLSTLFKISKVLKVSLDGLATKVTGTPKKSEADSEEE